MVTIQPIKTTNKIIDGVNLNNFGILLHDMKAIEDFQDKSGMAGAYRVEYQHHYVSAVGRINAGGQILDIAIPLVMYNYDQQVSGAAIEFHLNNVTAKNKEALPLAVKKFEELQQCSMFEKLTKIGFVDWEISGFHSNHQHPSGVNGFSGVDLRTNIHNPGVCFPLSKGENACNFAGIMQHKENFSEIIRTEYRVFNGKDGEDKYYSKGRCLTLVRGYDNPAIEEEPDIGDGPIDAIFGTTRPKPKPKPREKDRKDYILKDGFTSTEGDNIGKEIMTMWKECNFTIDTSMILEKHIKRAGYNTGKQNNLFRGMAEQWEDQEYVHERKKRKITKFIDRSHVWISEIEKKAMELVNLLNYDEEEVRSWAAVEVRETWNLEEIDIEEEKTLIESESKTIAAKAIDLMRRDKIMSEEKLKMLSYKDLELLFENSYQMDMSILEEMQL